MDGEELAVAGVDGNGARRALNRSSSTTLRKRLKK
jgi:hypothetical protein